MSVGIKRKLIITVGVVVIGRTCYRLGYLNGLSWRKEA